MVVDERSCGCIQLLVNDLNDIKLVETWRSKDERDFNSFGTFHGKPSPGGGRSDDQRRQVVSSKGLVQSRFLFLERNVSCGVL
jgi:hypothetical protein